MDASATVVSASPQYMRALERANKVRLARAELKRGVAGGEVDVARVILECPWETESMAVGDLLASQRRWGQTRCRKFLASVPMSENKTIGSMTERQRRWLASMLTGAPCAPVTSQQDVPAASLAPREALRPRPLAVPARSFAPVAVAAG